MLTIFNPILWRVLAVVALLAGVALLWDAAATHYENIGRAEVQARWDAAKLAEAQANAQETQRRLAAQKEADDATAKEIARLKADADSNYADAERLRQQNLDIVGRWRAALRNSPTQQQCASAGDAIGVLADVLGRADKRAGILAAAADSAHAAGKECERLYDALTPH